MNSSCLLCLYLTPFVCTIFIWDKTPPNQSSHGQCKAQAQSSWPSRSPYPSDIDNRESALLSSAQQSDVLAYYLLYYHSSLMCFEELPMLSVNSKQRSFQGRVLRSMQWLLQDKEIKWLPSRDCSTWLLAVNVGPYKQQEEREGGKTIAPFIKSISGFHPCCPCSSPHALRFSSVTITK